MSIFLNEEHCPKCGNDKMPFDVHCDNCYEFSVEVKTGKKLKMTEILCTLGYKYKELLEKGDGSVWLKDKFMLIIEAPRRDEKAIKQILKEET